MLASGGLLAFIAAAAVIIAIPGPSVLFVVGRALAVGLGGALMSVVGNGAGVLVQVIGVALGLGTLIGSSVELFTVVKLAGAAFLVYLGVQAIRRRAQSATDFSPIPVSPWRSFVEGAGVGITNPKTMIFLAALLPQFVSLSDGAVQLQLLALGGVFVVAGIIGDSIWVLAASAVRAWFARSPRRLEVLGAVGGAALIALGVGVAVLG